MEQPQSAGTFADRLRRAIGDESVNAFARRAGVGESLLRTYLSGSSPGLDKATKIARAANVSLDWLATDMGPMRLGDRTAAEMVGHVVPVRGGLGESAALRLQAGELGEFVLVPRYDIEASAGPGAFADREAVLDYMAFDAAWLRRVVGADPARLVLIAARGDSMEPTIRPGDLLLVDTSVGRIGDDSIYVVARGEALVVKRVKAFFHGAVIVKGDNPAYPDETLDRAEAESLRIAGRVRWIARII